MKIRQSSGFSAIGLIGAVSVGSILSLGYLNLSHYLIAESALEQATRTAVRCVSPTNAECGSSLPSTAEPRWKYLASVMSPRGDVYSEEYDYSARMFQSRFVAETPYYLIPQERAPQVSITTYSLPTARFSQIQSYKNVDITFQYQGEIERLFALPLRNPFPIFDPRFEENHENYSFSRKIADASSSQREVLERFTVVFESPFSQSISGNEAQRVGGEFIRHIDFGSIPSIPLSSLLAGEGQTQGCALGSVCGVRELAGNTGTSRANDYQHFRFLALYLEVEVTSRSSNVSLGIKGAGGESGLSLDVSGPRHSGKICLGGRDLTRLDSIDGNYFNLWLRGPAGSSGGTKGLTETQCEGSYRHSNLIVDKEGKFRPKVGLVVGGQRGDRVTGRVILRAFVDTYQEQVQAEPIVKTCSPISLKRGLTVAQIAPSLTQCGLSGEEKNLSRKIVSVNENNVGCVLNPEDLTLIPVSTEIPQALNESNVFSEVEIRSKEILSAQCVKNSYPLEPSACGWSLIPGSESRLEVGTLQTAACAEAEIKKELVECNDNKSVSTCNVDTMQVDACDAVKAKTEQLKLADKISGLPAGTNNEFKKELIRGQQIAPKYSCEQERSLDGQFECGKLLKKSLISEPQLVRINPNWKPTDSSLYDKAGDEPLCGQILPNQVSLLSPESEVINITGFPFDGESTFEISRSKPKLVNGKLGCSQEDVLPLTVEELLREYAALSGFKAALDPEIKFQYEARSLGSSKLVSSTLGCRTRELASLDGCPQLRTISSGSEACGAEIDLGSAQSEPPLCKEPGVVCRKEFDGIDQSLPTPPSNKESIEIATKLATDVLRKYLPQSKTTCSAPNCVEVKVEINPDKTVSASSSYLMPLTWPLDELLGRKSLELSRVRTERIEAL